MPVSKNILCTKHVKDNIERKLTEMEVGQKAKSEFCRDIFGGREEGKGLIHATTAELFDEQLALFENEWKAWERSSGIHRSSLITGICVGT